METEAERNIRLVIRILRYIGWPFAILFVGMAAVGALFAQFLVFANDDSIGAAVITTVGSGAIVGSSVAIGTAVEVATSISVAVASGSGTSVLVGLGGTRVG